MYKLSYYFMIFLIYSVIGYFCEITTCTIENKKLILSRGYLIGPIIPVFGFGGLIITLCLHKYVDNPMTLFILGTVYSCALEYITSFFMEKIYGLRWWDYSEKRYNINGRICLETGVLFGLGSLIIVNILNPIFFSILNKIPEQTMINMGILLLIIVLLDFIISTKAIIKLKIDTKIYAYKDATAEIKNQVRASIKRNALLYRRLLSAFPNIRREDIKIKNLTNFLNRAKSIRLFKTKNNKGFTLIELLAAIVIMGIISGMSFPLIRGLQEKNTNTKYAKFGESLVASAKLFMNSYEEDVFKYEEDLTACEREAGQCSYIKYSDLKEKNLIKDIGVSGLSCNSDFTFVKVTRIKGKYTYEYFLGCGDADRANKEGKIDDDNIIFVLPATENNEPHRSGSKCAPPPSNYEPQCTWEAPSFIRINEKGYAQIKCTSCTGFTSELTTVSFSSSNSSIARVTKVEKDTSTDTQKIYTVEIEGYSSGTANISLNEGALTANSGETVGQASTGEIQVVDFVLNTQSVNLNLSGTSQFQIHVFGGNYSSVTYSSNDSKIATVSNTGLIKAVGSGTATITVRETHYNITKTIKVNVTKSLVINYELSHLKSSNTQKSITKDEAYTTTLSSVSSAKYALPETIQVLIDNTPTNSYTYNKETGEVFVPSVKGDLKIIAQADVITTEIVSTAKSETATTETINGPITFKQAKEVKLYKFIPETTGNYRIYSDDPSADERLTDPYIYIFEESETVTTDAIDEAVEYYADTGSPNKLKNLSTLYNDDGGVGCNFSVTMNLTEGKTYYFAIRTYKPTTIQTFTGFHIEPEKQL